jgi:hypothetical protein
MAMKTFCLLSICCLLVGGCATSNTVESRKRERPADFARLKPEEKLAVEQGRLRSGMSAGGAYIAWGKPSEIISEGPTTTWIYRESRLKEHQSITIRTVRGQVFPEETRTLYPQVVCARIVFQDDLVKEWQRRQVPSY